MKDFYQITTSLDRGYWYEAVDTNGMEPGNDDLVASPVYLSPSPQLCFRCLC